jgi:hypothetical protein
MVIIVITVNLIIKPFSLIIQLSNDHLINKDITNKLYLFKSYIIVLMFCLVVSRVNNFEIISDH